MEEQPKSIPNSKPPISKPPKPPQQNFPYPQPPLFHTAPPPPFSNPPIQNNKRKLDNVDMHYFKIRAILREMRPNFIEVLRTPDFRKSKAACEIRMQMKLVMDGYRQMVIESAYSDSLKNQSAALPFPGESKMTHKVMDNLEGKTGKQHHPDLIPEKSPEISAPGIFISEVPVGGNTFKMPETVGGNTFKMPETVGGTTFKMPETVGGTTFKIPETVGGTTFKMPETVGGNTSKKPETVGGNTSKKPETVGGNTSKKLETVGGNTSKKSEQKKPETVGGNAYKKPEDSSLQGSYVVGGSNFGWNFIMFPGSELVYYGVTKAARLASRRAAK